jgi:WD40 repeat protein
MAITLASGAIDIWNTDPYEHVGYLGEHLGTMEGQAFPLDWSSDGNYIAAGYVDGMVRVWEVLTGAERLEQPGIDYSFQIDDIEASLIQAVFFSPDGQTLQSVSGYGTIRQWDVATGHVLNTTTIDERLSAAAFNADGTRLAYAGDADSIQVIEPFPITEPEVRPFSMMWSPNGERIAAGYTDGTIRIWDSATNQLLLTITAHSAPVGDIYWSPDSTRLISGGNDGRLELWDSQNGQHIQTVLDTSWTIMQTVGWSPDGKYSVGIISEGHPNLFVFDALTGEKVFEDTEGTSNQIRWNPDSSQMAIISINGNISIRDASTFQQLYRLEYESETPFGLGVELAWSPDGTLLAQGSGYGNVRVWNMANQQVLYSGRSCSSAATSEDIWVCSIKALAFSPDGQSLQAIARDHTTTTWDATTGEVLDTYPLEGIELPLYGAAFNADGTRLAYAGDADSIQVIEPPYPTDDIP